MPLFQDIVEGFTRGYLSAAGQPSHCERGRIDQILREIGWSADERDGDIIKLHFKDEILGVRKVVISGGDAELVTFAVVSFLFLGKDDVPDQIAPYLLLRNYEHAIGSWYACVTDKNTVGFVLRYVALGAGLNAQLLHHICSKMVPEVAAFDRKMQCAGLLNL